MEGDLCFSAFVHFESPLLLDQGRTLVPKRFHRTGTPVGAAFLAWMRRHSTGYFASAAGAFCINSASKVSDASSPTTTPPASVNAFHTSPKSLRLIFAVADTPVLILPQGSLTGGTGPSTSKATSRVAPRIVGSPATLNRSLPAGVIFFERKVMVGWLATSKKSALRRCSSRCNSRVSMDEVSMLTSTVDFAGSNGSSTALPLTLVNSPRTFEIIKCRTLKCAAE